MKSVLYCIWQCTWGILQTVLGLLVFIVHIQDRHFVYHGAVVTEWMSKSSVSLGMFVFVTKEPYFYEKLKSEYTMEELSERLLVHEYGHTIQSLILGPLYLILIGNHLRYGASCRPAMKKEKMAEYPIFPFV